MSLYIIEDNSGNVLDECGEFNNSMIDAMLYDEHIGAELDVNEYGGHIVELIEAPEKVVVSEEEAKILERAKRYKYPAIFISNQTNDEDRLMRAYVNGWEVEKPKRYLIKVPHTDDSYFYKIDDEYCNAGDSYHLEAMTDKKWFTAAEIEHYGLHDYERVEVTYDEQ